MEKFEIKFLIDIKNIIEDQEDLAKYGNKFFEFENETFYGIFIGLLNKNYRDFETIPISKESFILCLEEYNRREKIDLDSWEQNDWDDFIEYCANNWFKLNREESYISDLLLLLADYL